MDIIANVFAWKHSCKLFHVKKIMWKNSCENIRMILRDIIANVFAWKHSCELFRVKISHERENFMWKNSCEKIHTNTPAWSLGILLRMHSHENIHTNYSGKNFAWNNSCDYIRMMLGVIIVDVFAWKHSHEIFMWISRMKGSALHQMVVIHTHQVRVAWTSVSIQKCRYRPCRRWRRGGGTRDRVATETNSTRKGY